MYAVLPLIYEALKRGAHVSTNIHLVGWDHATGAIDPSKGCSSVCTSIGVSSRLNFNILTSTRLAIGSSASCWSTRVRNIVVLDEVNEWFDSVDRDKIRTDSDFRNIQRFPAVS